MRKTSLSLLFLVLVGILPSFAQSLQVGDPFEQYYRFLQTIGAAEGSGFMNRPYLLGDLIQSMDENADHPWKQKMKLRNAADFEQDFYWGLFDPIWFSSVNTYHPRGHNDGALWQGKGYNTQVSAGGFVHYKGLTLSLRPNFNHSENREFLLSNWSFRDAEGNKLIYYPRRHLDAPQRFGTDPYTFFDWGQTSIRYDWKNLGIGVGRENMWWGPGQQSSILMSNNAAGFWHGHLGTNAPIKTKAGTFEAKLVWGYLEESDFYRETRPNHPEFTLGRTRTFSSFTFTYEPVFAPNLTFGLSRQFSRYVPLEGFNWRIPFEETLELFQPFRKEGLATSDNPQGNDPDDQQASVFFRWIFPESNFELYGEWAREDHSWNLRDIFQEPFHASAFILGLTKAWETSPSVYYRTSVESVFLSNVMTNPGRGAASFYTHGVVRQGYTQRGQFIGFWAGTGSNKQYFEVERYNSWGKIGVFVERVLFDDDMHRQMRNRDAFVDGATYETHRVDMGYGLNFTLLDVYGFEIHGRAMVIDAYSFANRHKYQGAPFPVPEGFDWDRVDKQSFHFSLTLRKPIFGFR